MQRTSLLAISLPVLLATCGCGGSDESHLLQVYQSPAAVAMVRSAPTVTAQLLGGEGYHRQKSSEYETRGEPVSLSADQAARLRELLLNPASYDFDSAKGCQPLYGARLRFQHEDSRIVDVLLCFECDILAVYFDDEAVGGEDFDAVSEELRSLMKELFPDDPEIGKL